MTLLDSILYPEDKKYLSKKYSLYDRNSNPDPKADEKKACDYIENSNYNQVKEILAELSD